MRPHHVAAWLAALTVTVLGIGATPHPSGAPPAGSAAPGAAARGKTPSHAGPEHALLQRDEGVWDATLQIAAGASDTIEVYNGAETNRLVAGGLWLITEFESQIGGVPFQGHGILGYDRVKKKYTRLWADSSQAVFWPSEGDYDPATDTLTLWMEAPDSQGVMVRWKTTLAWTGDDTRTFTMFVPGPESTEAAGMTITYKRRK